MSAANVGDRNPTLALGGWGDHVCAPLSQQKSSPPPPPGDKKMTGPYSRLLIFELS